MGDLELETKNEAESGTLLVPDCREFGSKILLWADASRARTPIHGLIGFGQQANGVWGESVRFIPDKPPKPPKPTGKAAAGADFQVDPCAGDVVTGSGSGVFGRGTFGVQGEGLSIGVLGTVFGPASAGTDVGVQGQGSRGVIGLGTSDGVWGEASAGTGVIGLGTSEGVWGQGRIGVAGGGTRVGVLGDAAPGTSAMGVVGRSRASHAVFGDNRGTINRRSGACVGVTDIGYGVYGVVTARPPKPTRPLRRPVVNNAAVRGEVLFDPRRPSEELVAAIYGVAPKVPRPRGPKVRLYPTFQGFAGIFDGPVAINGPLTVFGASPKSAAVRHPDGNYRRLYCLEAPESLFEDVGRARLRAGSATVRLDPQFAALIRTDDYHVFLTAEGECQALSVAARRRNGFTVREAGKGRSGTSFSYRIVAKRRDVDAPRLERVSPPVTRATRLLDPRLAEVPARPGDLAHVSRVHPARPRGPAGGPMPKPARAAAQGSRERSG